MMMEREQASLKEEFEEIDILDNDDETPRPSFSICNVAIDNRTRLKRISTVIEETEEAMRAMEKRIITIEEKFLTYYQLFIDVKNDTQMLHREHKHLLSLVADNQRSSKMTLDFVHKRAVEEEEAILKQAKRFDRLTGAIKVFSILLLIVVAAMIIWIPEVAIIDRLIAIIAALLV